MRISTDMQSEHPYDEKDIGVMFLLYIYIEYAIQFVIFNFTSKYSLEYTIILYYIYKYQLNVRNFLG